MENSVFTYLMYDGCYYKIGKTNNVEKRFNEIHSSNINIKLLYYIDRDIERRLHKLFLCKHVSKEWFDLDDKHINFFKKYFVKNTDIFQNSCRNLVATQKTKGTKKEKKPKKESIPMDEYIEMNKNYWKELGIERINNVVEDWDFKRHGKITTRKIYQNSNINKKVVDKYYKFLKDKIKNLNNNFVK